MCWNMVRDKISPHGNSKRSADRSRDFVSEVQSRLQALAQGMSKESPESRMLLTTRQTIICPMTLATRSP